MTTVKPALRGSEGAHGRINERVVDPHIVSSWGGNTLAHYLLIPFCFICFVRSRIKHGATDRIWRITGPKKEGVPKLRVSAHI